VALIIGESAIIGELLAAGSASGSAGAELVASACDMTSFDVLFSAFSSELDADCESELIGVSAATTCEEESGGTICK
jgi:hypothetical protein